MSDLNIGGDWDFNVSRAPLTVLAYRRLVSAYTWLVIIVTGVAAAVLPLALGVAAVLCALVVLSRLQYSWGYAQGLIEWESRQRHPSSGRLSERNPNEQSMPKVCHTCLNVGWIVEGRTYDWPYGEQVQCPDCDN